MHNYDNLRKYNGKSFFRTLHVANITMFFKYNLKYLKTQYIFHFVPLLQTYVTYIII